MGIIIDAARAHEAAQRLHKSFATIGILGQTQMPEDIVPDGIQKGSLKHLLFITLTVSIDYQRDAVALWESSRRTYEDSETRYLFDPLSLHETSPKKIAADMKRHGLSKKMNKDASIWRTVGVTFYKKWGGNPLTFLEDSGWDSTQILERLKNDTHQYFNHSVPDYPYLRGPKIGPLWIRMLRDNVGIESLKNLEKIPIPVDIHVARASLALGAVRGGYSGNLVDVFQYIREAWHAGTNGISLSTRDMIALDVDEPLWHLSKYGCTNRAKDNSSCPRKNDCELKDFCIDGVIEINKYTICLET